MKPLVIGLGVIVVVGAIGAIVWQQQRVGLFEKKDGISSGATSQIQSTPGPTQIVPVVSGEEPIPMSPTQSVAKPTASPTLVSEKPAKLTAPSMQIDKTKNYTAVLTTSAGVIKIKLHASTTPITANNFVYLAKNKLYDGTIFHRVINGFMIQGGDPAGNGTGGPGYQFNDEPFTGEYSKGTVAMANAGPNTNGSQFFIMHADYPLQKNYVIFGSVIEGLDVVDKIATAPVKTGMGGENSTPVTPVKVQTVTILEQ